MAAGFEPAFAPGRPVWPLAGLLAQLEADDPDLAIPRGALEPGLRDAPEQAFLADRDGRVGNAPAEPLGPKPPKSPDGQRKWKLALAASCILHASVALFFLQLKNDAVLIEGAELSGIAFLGNAPEDQVSAGDLAETDDPAVNVTMITILDAKPVETVDAEAVPVEEASDIVETVEAETATTERLEPVRDIAVKPENAATAIEPERQAEPAPTTMPERAVPIEDHQAPAPALAEIVPEILAADTLKPVENDNVVQKPVEVAPAMPVETAEAVPVEMAETELVEPSATKPVEPDQVIAALAEPEEKPVEEKKTPPEKEPVKQALKKPAPEKKAAKPEEAKPTKKPAKKPVAKTTKTGNGGQNAADARRGQADGQAEGKAAAKSKGGKNSASGNAAVSNYPGKIVAKLRRALRYPAEAKRQKLRGEVQVSFVVSAGGGVGSIRVVSSSGSPILDSAAVETVRRAAPFPAIPSDAGRSSWPFTVPLAFMR